MREGVVVREDVVGVGERVVVVASLEASLLVEGRCGVATLMIGEKATKLLNNEEWSQC
jgi:hypothetical protein